jgi:hypothetical protein
MPTYLQTTKFNVRVAKSHGHECSSAVAHLFSKGVLFTRGGRALQRERYTSIAPTRRLAGVAHYCDVHGSTSNCP